MAARARSVRCVTQRAAVVWAVLLAGCGLSQVGPDLDAWKAAQQQDGGADGGADGSAAGRADGGAPDTAVNDSSGPADAATDVSSTADAGAADGEGAADADAGTPCTSAADCPAAVTPCQAAACQAGWCQVVAQASGACDDGSACTVDDTCKNGQCSGVSRFGSEVWPGLTGPLLALLPQAEVGGVVAVTAAAIGWRKHGMAQPLVWTAPVAHVIDTAVQIGPSTLLVIGRNTALAQGWLAVMAVPDLQPTWLEVTGPLAAGATCSRAVVVDSERVALLCQQGAAKSVHRLRYWSAKAEVLDAAATAGLVPEVMAQVGDATWIGGQAVGKVAAVVRWSGEGGQAAKLVWSGKAADHRVTGLAVGAGPQVLVRVEAGAADGAAAVLVLGATGSELALLDAKPAAAGQLAAMAWAGNHWQVVRAVATGASLARWTPTLVPIDEAPLTPSPSAPVQVWAADGGTFWRGGSSKEGQVWVEYTDPWGQTGCAKVDCAKAGGVCASGPGCGATLCTTQGCQSIGPLCDDGNPCTVGEGCGSGSCGSGNTVSCDDGNPCTLDSCMAASGCVHLAASATAPCDDGDVCTLGDGCKDGACTANAILNCPSDGTCSVGTCVPFVGCKTADAPPGLGCSGSGKCNGKLCLAGQAATFAVGPTHSCYLDFANKLRCWGDNGDHAISAGDTAQFAEPQLVTLDGSVIWVAAGEGFTCVVQGDGKVRCWGRNEHSQCGAPATAQPLLAPHVVALPEKAWMVVAGRRHACAGTDAGVFCWGAGKQGQLGNGMADSAKPLPVKGLGTDVGWPAAGGDNTCCPSSDLKVRCWGASVQGWVGAAAPTDGAVVMPLGGEVVQVAVGNQHACAWYPSGGAWCWGDNSLQGWGQAPAAGQIGTRLLWQAKIDAVSVGAQQTCVVIHDGIAAWPKGSLACWQDPLLTGPAATAPWLQQPGPGKAIEYVASAGLRTCAKAYGGALTCWQGAAAPGGAKQPAVVSGTAPQQLP